MHIRLLAVGSKQPQWVDDCCALYQLRLPKTWRFQLVEIAQGKPGHNDKARQGQRVLDALAPSESLIALDERGRSMNSEKFSEQLGRWSQDARDLAFVIGGADGLDKSVLERSLMTLSLSSMTMPHGMARAMFMEQLYRAHSLLSGHPYHRA